MRQNISGKKQKLKAPLPSLCNPSVKDNHWEKKEITEGSKEQKRGQRCS